MKIFELVSIWSKIYVIIGNRKKHTIFKLDLVFAFRSKGDFIVHRKIDVIVSITTDTKTGVQYRLNLCLIGIYSEVEHKRICIWTRSWRSNA